MAATIAAMNVRCLLTKARDLMECTARTLSGNRERPLWVESRHSFGVEGGPRNQDAPTVTYCPTAYVTTSVAVVSIGSGLSLIATGGGAMTCGAFARIAVTTMSSSAERAA